MADYDGDYDYTTAARKKKERLGDFVLKVDDRSKYYKLNRMKKPSGTALLTDTAFGNAAADERNIGLGCWKFTAFDVNSDYAGVAPRHGDRANLAFADGHGQSLGIHQMHETPSRIRGFIIAGERYQIPYLDF
ncbi:hypothetical protein SDC9_189942 [bioreactor metagenome]|uniref:Uncharacterized protein n=1 Tax=bioreactor metagenome TaxID=1076179 RepID=A0A645HTJ4_9ZZZZ